ncbi:hypothetical protein N8I77_004040 [Diaporthe amygdali]|uniref:diacylglycerol O-acyltransferase n=1 Tax=Phomopsis amygdali TaxID=1214568 RepID=A0AAD9SL63_PHOAM|nr:hypothetical protein N8I77_004040 [Diaporthe amygdali]
MQPGPDLELEMDDHRHSSASSSPPTHPSFFMASPVIAHAGGAGATSGKENPSNDVEQPADSNASKKSKRKSKKTNGVKEKNKANTEDQAASQPTSYAEAVKEDPADVADRQDRETKEESNGSDPSQKANADQPVSEKPDGDAIRSEAEGTEDKNGDKKESQPTAAGSLTFAEAVKEGSSDTAQTNGQATEPDNAKPRSIEKSSIQEQDSTSAHSSQGSTAVDYPDIPSDAEDRGEEAARRQDQEKAQEVAGLRWAPLKVPFKRRLQTLAVLFHCLCMGTTLSIFFAFCAIPLLWPLLIIYLVSILFATDAVDGKLRRRKEWVRRLPIWKYFAEYYPAKLHKTHDLLPTRKYIFGYHPHGIISHGAWAAFATEALGFSQKFPGITNSLLTLDSNFRLPLYREYVFSMGVLSVSKESITNILTRGGLNGEGMGRAVTIVVGGARESLEAQPRTARLIINERKGFVKLAMRTGADLVPVMAFGENDLYDQLDPHKHPWLHGLQRHVLKVWKFTVPLLHGRGIFNYDVGMMPYRRPLNIVVGRPIMVAQADNPDNSEVDRLHDLYVEELRAIWDRYKDEFAKDRLGEMEFLS